jgi:uncharacterized membrane protein
VTEDPLARFEQRLGRLLVSGVVVSAVLLATGLLVWLWRPSAPPTAWLLNAGLIVLMGTPIVRVIVSVAEYVRLREWFFVIVTLIVLTELTVTVAVALARR